MGARHPHVIPFVHVGAVAVRVPRYLSRRSKQRRPNSGGGAVGEKAVTHVSNPSRSAHATWKRFPVWYAGASPTNST
jgi:hypothetical protein